MSTGSPSADRPLSAPQYIYAARPRPSRLKTCLPGPIMVKPACAQVSRAAPPDAINMSPTLLLFFLFWSFGPALLAMWLFREGGRSRFVGFLAGFFFGLLGVLAALLVVKLAGPPPTPPAPGEPTGGRPVRVFYAVPLIGRLHVSTVWALAGVATFVCAWGSGGAGYELYRAFERGEVFEWRERALRAKIVSRSSPAAGDAASQISEQETQSLQAESSQTQPQPSLLNSLVASPKQSRSESSVGSAREMSEAMLRSTAPVQPTPILQAATPAVRQETVAAQPPASAPSSAATPDAPQPAAQPTAPPHQTVVSEATRLLASNGHRVHASLSGEGKATTLTVSGATLTRATGGQLLGNGRVREALRSSGVRVVVLVNGAESWTFIL